MFLYILIAAVTIAAAALINETANCGRGTRGAAVRSSCLVLLFLTLLVPAALRQETGNDYLRYVEFFHLASIDAYVPTEPGFNALVKLIYWLCGYENYLLVFAVFAALTILFFLIAIRQQAEDFLFSFFLFMMSGYYFQSFNTMRYYLALAVAMMAMTCYLRRNYVGFLALAVLAALFHKSALIILILYPIAGHVWKKWEYVLAVVIGGVCLAYHGKVLEVLVNLYPTWEDTGDLAAGTSVSWVNIGKCLAALFLAACVYRMKSVDAPDMNQWRESKKQGGNISKVKKSCTDEGILTFQVKRGAEVVNMTGQQEKKEGTIIVDRPLRFYLNASFLGLLFYVFGWFIPEVSRICYYLTVSQIFLFPKLIGRIPESREKEKKRLTWIICIAAVVYFAFFLRAAYGETTKILPYRTFLFHDLDATPSGSIGLE